MKRVIALILSLALLLTGCGQNVVSTASSQATSTETSSTEASSLPEATQAQQTEATETQETAPQESPVEQPATSEAAVSYEFKNVVPSFGGLDDPNLLRYVEDNLYSELVTELNSSEYFVENVSAVYLSEEYIEELTYNSRKNVYFGYSLQDLDEAFQGTRYVFTLGANNETVVEPFEGYDDTYEKVIKNVAIGSGVILICVTVSVATAGAGAPAISMIFAAGAKTGATMALSSGAFSGVAATIVTGIQTHDMEQAMKAGLLAGSEGFKWGAITGAISGGVTEGVKYAKAMEALKGVALNGITTQEAAAIQMESGFPVDIIKQFHSMEEYKVYKDAGLAAKMVNGELALVRDLDLTFKSELPDGRIVSNLERMAEGYAPLDPITGKAYQLHHIGQKADATLAVLTEAEHQGNATILNMIGKESEIDRAAFDAVRKAFWKAYAAAFA